MTESGALLRLPAAEPTGEKDALQANAQLLTESLKDLDLTERVQRALRATGYEPLRCIEVTVHAQFVLLAGRVPSDALKQIAQMAALAVPGAYQVRNNLEVV